MVHKLGILLAVAMVAGCADWSSGRDEAFPTPHREDPVSRPEPDAGGTPRPLPADVVQASDPPPPISGGTLLAVDEGRAMLASDPDRDVVWLVSIYEESLLPSPFDDIGASIVVREPGRGVLGSIALLPGDEPGRLVEVPGGSAWVVLRGGGAIAELDLATLSVRSRVEVCAAPRGIAHHPGRDALLVACLEGGLRIVPLADATAVRTVPLPDDLRDVVVSGGRVYVSRFRSAQVFRLDAGLTRVVDALGPRSFFDGPRPPAIAWRMVAHPTGGVVLSHQTTASEAAAVPIAPGGYGGAHCSPAIVTSAVTRIRDTGSVETTMMLDSVLPVDVAVAVRDHGIELALASAGNRNDDFGRAGALTVASLETITSMVEGFSCGLGGRSFDDGRQVVAVAFDGRGEVVMQTRDPWAIVTREAEHTLPGPSRKDTGHDLFHEDAGGGIACASCHAEGGEDGRVWTFAGLGPRRTQELRGTVIGTEPFHWSGDMVSFEMLAHEVLGRRMGGPMLPPEHAQAMLEWIDSMELPAREPPTDLAAVERGRTLFQSSELACTTCHAGPNLTHHTSFVVREGDEAFQVPSLLGVGIRAPYMHDGCGEDLRERFDAACGGSLHGNTAGLSDAELGDLIAYLETL